MADEGRLTCDNCREPIEPGTEYECSGACGLFDDEDGEENCGAVYCSGSCARKCGCE